MRILKAINQNPVKPESKAGPKPQSSPASALQTKTSLELRPAEPQPNPSEVIRMLNAKISQLEHAHNPRVILPYHQLAGHKSDPFTCKLAPNHTLRYTSKNTYIKKFFISGTLILQHPLARGTEILGGKSSKLLVEVSQTSSGDCLDIDSLAISSGTRFKINHHLRVKHLHIAQDAVCELLEDGRLQAETVYLQGQLVLSSDPKDTLLGSLMPSPERQRAFTKHGIALQKCESSAYTLHSLGAQGLDFDEFFVAKCRIPQAKMRLW